MAAGRSKQAKRKLVRVLEEQAAFKMLECEVLWKGADKTVDPSGARRAVEIFVETCLV